MKALEKDRTRRDQTAGFAADVLRHLAHEPVVAAPPSGVYRLRKFVRKHRGAVIASDFRMDTALDALRRRGDFNKLIAELEKSDPPKPGK